MNKNMSVVEYGSTQAPLSLQLRLYVTDWTPRCVQAYRNLKKICEDNIKDRYDIEVVDILQDPGIARREQIVAVPTLVKMTPKPQKIMVGDFSQTQKVLSSLGL